MQLCRLVYKSKTSWDVLTNEILLKLAERCARNNGERNISGLLVLSDETFLQVLEGPDAEVNHLYSRIIRDDLHSEVTLLSYEQIAARSFEDWSMRVVDLNDLPMESRDLFRQKYDDREGYIQVPDDALKATALLFDARALCLAESRDT
tara:strand:- start:1386 stop:1832 length:447 start_codon:yes stop_codon:yes gene_type:complete